LKKNLTHLVSKNNLDFQTTFMSNNLFYFVGVINGLVTLKILY